MSKKKNFQQFWNIFHIAKTIGQPLEITVVFLGLLLMDLYVLGLICVVLEPQRVYVLMNMNPKNRKIVLNLSNGLPNNHGAMEGLVCLVKVGVDSMDFKLPLHSQNL